MRPVTSWRNWRSEGGIAADHRSHLYLEPPPWLCIDVTRFTGSRSEPDQPEARSAVRCVTMCAPVMRALGTQSEGPSRKEGPLREQRSAIPEHVGVLREAVVRFAAASGASQRSREQIALAVSEALSNCVIHAYAGRDQPGQVTVEAWARDGSLIVLVSDEGCGMVPRLDSPGLGIGLPLIAQMSDQLDVEARDGQPGVRLRMTFAIA